jgi:hypothetical protein
MPAVATHADAIRLKVGGVEIAQLANANTIPGVQVLAVAARCGPGRGLLTLDAGQRLTWQSPGATLPGDLVDVSAGGDFLVESWDAACWVRVHVEAAYLVAGSQAAVYLADVYDNAIADGDVAAADAAAGVVQTWSITLANNSSQEVQNLRAWLDASVVDITISADGASWVTPTSEATAVSLGTLPAAASAMLHVQRTIASDAAPQPRVLSLIHLAFDLFD